MSEDDGADVLEEAARRRAEDEKLLRRAERAMTEMKVAQGLSEHHASVLAALRIRLKGDPGKKLEDLLEAAGDLEPDSRLDDLLQRGEEKTGSSLDDLLSAKPKPKPEWPGS